MAFKNLFYAICATKYRKISDLLVSNFEFVTKCVDCNYSYRAQHNNSCIKTYIDFKGQIPRRGKNSFIYHIQFRNALEEKNSEKL